MANAISNYLTPGLSSLMKPGGVQTTTPAIGALNAPKTPLQSPGALVTSALGLKSPLQQPMATSVATKQPVAGSVSGLLTAPAAPVQTGGYTASNSNVGTGLISSPNIGSSLGNTGTTGGSTTGTSTGNGFSAPPTPGLFSSVATSLANPSTNVMTQQGSDAYNKAVQDLKNFEVSAAAQKQAIDSAPTSARVMQGRNSAVQQANAETEAALQQAVSQTQQEVGFGQAQQGLNQNALESVAGLVKPSPTSYGQTVFQPQTGTFTGGSGNLDPQTASTDLATKVLSEQMTYDQAVSSLGYAGAAGQQFLNNAIKQQNPNYNIPQGQATTQGAAAVAGSIPSLNAAATAAEGYQNQINALLQANPQLNQSQLIPANAIQQWLSGQQLGNPEYQTLFNFLAEYANTMAPVLGVGGDPTNLKTQIANSLVNAQASGESISQVLSALQTSARTKIANIQSGANGGGVTNPASTSTGTGGGWGSISY